MNQELTQRIIGAIVLTALAAIFIPMLFEDPVDNSGQMVSELTIPEEPAITMDDSASKLPRNADDIAPLPDETTETPDKNGLSDTENMPPPMEEGELAGDPNDPELPGEGAMQNDSALPEDSPIDQPPAAAAAAAPVVRLDTGDVSEVKKPGKKPHTVKETVKETPKPPAHEPPKATPAKTQPKAPPPPPKPAKATGSLGRYYLQAGTFSKRENALALSDTIRKQGMPVQLDTIQTSKGTMYRLRVGPELDKKRAETMRSKLQQQNIGSMLVGE